MNEVSFWSKGRLQSIVLIAVFNFIFLGTEYLFDGRMALFCDSEAVVMAQNIVLGVSVIGFLLYALVERAFTRRSKDGLLLGLGLILMACIFGIGRGGSYGFVMTLGLIAFVIFGIFGSAACYFTVNALTDKRHLAKTVGMAYAFGILLQFLNNNLVKGELAQTICLMLVSILYTAILVRSWRILLEGRREPASCEEGEMTEEKKKAARTLLITLIIVVALLTCIFSMLDNAVTLVHASGEFNIGQWPRLILAVSGLVAGFLYDLGGRRFMDVIMYLISVLAVIAVLILTLGGSFVIGLMVFYLSAGFFVVFFMTAFMDASADSSCPALFAGLGRAVNNLCALLTSAISVMLLSGSSMTCLIATLICLALISVSLKIYRSKSSYLYESKIEESMVIPAGEEGAKELAEEISVQAGGKLSSEEHFQRFVNAYGLTDREAEVLKALLASDDNVQDIASELSISRAALYRHIAAIQEKTGSKSRMGIVRSYYES